MKGITIKKEQVNTLLETRFINVYDLQYSEGKHYYDATRRKLDELVAVKNDEEFKNMLPDAVTICVILRMDDGDRLLNFYEYRYPAGHFLLSPPAGLIDEADRSKPDAIELTAVRELYEETGIVFHADKDTVRVINPGVFSSPGMTDECNGIALIIINEPDLSSLSSSNSTGTELFDGFELLTKQDAAKCISEGRDSRGNLYSIYTWQALLYFVSDIWKEYIK